MIAQLIAEYQRVIANPFAACHDGTLAHLLSEIPNHWNNNSILFDAHYALSAIQHEHDFARLAGVSEAAERAELEQRAALLPTLAQFKFALVS